MEINLKNKKELANLLNKEFKKRNSKFELSFEKPDPLFVAKKYNDEYVALICALFAYGNAHQIVKFLSSLDFSLLDTNEKTIRKNLKDKYYRFQNNEDVVSFFIALYRLKKSFSLQDIFYDKYHKQRCVLSGIEAIITAIKKSYDYSSCGYDFLIGKVPKKDKSGKIKYNTNSPYKRYNMFLRWMVRKDNIDLGLWTKVDKKDLILPLDTHTFNICKKLGLLDRKTYDLKSAILITQKLKELDPLDPIKYDFAIYRLGQEKIL